ncbi:MAG: methylenetetrahydrofolate--tRNA-(uracil(54)-C(5))-methyltransferase (FADH(2)-oxidizing) TrmFO [Oscillospiraceae bacterium]|nr:methylenetetrahydrofolate--tRNA-(uracil(54)-C(5))-methyltransferase (FADH(2)-oxidizing) TrmFO [Oscillospiraceae bacterium]
MNKKVIVIGAGLAGVEAAWQCANAGIETVLYEMKPNKFSPAHHNPNFAELVCSNSLKASRLESAAGLLKAEMRLLGSVCMECAEKCAVPAGGALAVDRDEFSALVTEKIESHPLIRVIHEEATEIPDGNVIVAAGPLASEALSESIRTLCGSGLSFYDAAAPIVTAESIDMQSAFCASRYDRGGDDDYINCPMNQEEYEAFHEALVNAESAEVHSFDRRKDVYEGCMPIEVMAKRGKDTIRFGPLKPVGLRDPNTGHRPWAVLQLRKENKNGTMYNLVGFQTNLKFGEQKRVFSMIPALKNAEFVRYGVMHRNTFLDSPRLLAPSFSFKNRQGLFFAGQITGVEGYMESAASGIMAGINMVRVLSGKPELVLPETTMIGALSHYISDESVKNFQPMGANFGVLPPIEPKIRDKKLRYKALSERAIAELENILNREQ